MRQVFKTHLELNGKEIAGQRSFIGYLDYSDLSCRDISEEMKCNEANMYERWQI